MIRRELGIFLVVGSLTVLVDFIVYRCLAILLDMAVDPAKAIGFVAGTIFAYFANRFWTFGLSSHGSGSAWRFAILYSLTLAANVMVNAAMLAVFQQSSLVVQAAFVIATGVSASLNFIGMKLFVFRPHADVELP